MLIAQQKDEVVKCTRLLQISDIHLFADANKTLFGVNTRDSFNLILETIAADTFKPDIILLSGDLSQDNSPESYKHLISALSNLSNIYWVPGNHDDPKLMQKILTKKFIADKIILTLEKWQIILLNSNQPRKVPGFLAEKELQYLQTNLANNNYRYAAIVLHHQPIPVGCAWLDSLGLQNANDFFRIIAQEDRVKAVIYGHVHQVHEEKRNGVNFLSAPSTCVQFLPKSKEFALDTKQAPGYRCFELWENGELKTWVNRLKNYPHCV